MPRGEDSDVKGQTATVTIIGAGIHGMHIAERLVNRAAVEPREITLVDPEPPLAVWDRRTRACGMAHLRSIASHGIGARLADVARADDVSYPPWNRPSTAVFRRHAEDVRAALADARVVADRAVCIVRDRSAAGSDGSADRWIVTTAAGTSVVSPIVVIAAGPPEPARPRFIDASAPCRGSIVHLYDEAPNAPTPPRERILVVGGGIAAVHRALRGVADGAMVALWHADHQSRRWFDSDPGFIGQRCGAAWRSIADDRDREEAVRRARRSGSIPPDLQRDLAAAERAGRVERARVALTGVACDGTRVVATSDRGTRRHFDRVILATGFSATVPAADLVAATAASNALPRTGAGFPIVDATCAWANGLYVTGGLADYVIGPPARNIIGAHLAGRRMEGPIVDLIATLRHSQRAEPAVNADRLSGHP